MRKWNVILGRKKRWCFRAVSEPTRPRLNRFIMLRRKFWLSWRGGIAIGYLYFGVAALSELSGAYILMLLGHPFKYDFFGTGLKQIASSLVLISVAAVPFMMLFIRPAQHATDARLQFLGAERFHHVVISAELEAGDAIGHIA